MNEWWNAFTGVERFFLTVAIPFSLLTLIQLIMELIGMGGDHGHDSGGLDGGDVGGFYDHLHFFSVRNMIYFLTMFGWVGLACTKGGFPVILVVPFGIIAGLVTTVIIAWIFYALSKFTESGNVQLSNALGKVGNVYLPIPAKRTGKGAVQVAVQGILQELDAITDGDNLSSGTSIQVVDVLNNNTVVVAPSDTLSANL
jgi:hypothetical protein